MTDRATGHSDHDPVKGPAVYDTGAQPHAGTLESHSETFIHGQCLSRLHERNAELYAPIRKMPKTRLRVMLMLCSMTLRITTKNSNDGSLMCYVLSRLNNAE